MSPRESQVLLEFLWEHVVRPEFTVRFRWAPGSVAFWDNRATQHVVSNDFLPARRIMERVTIVGDRPY
jgi:taurine dioxygenase